MSCRLLEPDETPLVAPMIYRQIGPAQPGNPEPHSGASDRGPDYAAQIAQLQRLAEQQVREARAAGMKEGETAGRNRAAAELQPVIERLSSAIDEISGLRARLRREAESDMVKLSMAIARRILRRELALD